MEPGLDGADDGHMGANVASATDGPVSVAPVQGDADEAALCSRDHRLGGRFVARAGLVLVTAGLTVIVGGDGSAVWRIVRALAVLAVSVAAWRGLDARRPVRIAIATGIGLVAVPIGVGIGLPHAVKTGWSGYTLAGLATLFGGLLLLTCASVWWCQPARPLWWVPRAVAMLVACALATWTLGQAVAATNAPPTTLDAGTPADLGLEYRDVVFPAADGVLLSGWYVPSRKDAAVVLLHGAGSTRSDVLEHAVVLARHGYGVLLYDARGHGLSEGRAMDFGWYGDSDVAGAVDYVLQVSGVDPQRIAVVGMSMGGEQAIGAAASIPELSAVVAEGATNRVAGDKGWLSDEFGWRGSISEGVEATTYWFTDLLTDADPPITLRQAVRVAAPTPVLLIAGGDVAEELHAADYISQGSPTTVEVWVAPETGHTQALRVHPAEWERRVISFLDGALAQDG
jgi:pimeloyl-ACP methyl ester carboxylesterase